MQKNNSGQTTMEYILLVAVLMGLLTLVFNHPLFKEFRKGGGFINQVAAYIQYCYRHAAPDQISEKYPPNYLQINHSSYQGQGGNSRFFGPKQGYP